MFSFYIPALELVGPEYRSFVTVMTCTFYTFGIMMLAGVTYLVRDWVQMCLYTSVPFLLYFLYMLVMPESPRWLLAKGKLEQALDTLEVMARINKKTLPNTFRIKLHERVEADKIRVKSTPKSVGAFDLCKTPNMRLKTLLITLNWFANETVYLGLSYYGPSLGNNQYLSFFLSSLVEIPSYLCCWFVMDRWGRRWPMCLLMIFRFVQYHIAHHILRNRLFFFYCGQRNFLRGNCTDSRRSRCGDAGRIFNFENYDFGIVSHHLSVCR